MNGNALQIRRAIFGLNIYLRYQALNISLERVDFHGDLLRQNLVYGSFLSLAALSLVHYANTTLPGFIGTTLRWVSPVFRPIGYSRICACT